MGSPDAYVYQQFLKGWVRRQLLSLDSYPATCYSDLEHRIKELTKEEPLDIQIIVKELKRERERLNKAIAALEETDLAPAPRVSSPVARSPAPPTKSDRLTDEGRRRLSVMMKKRWADKRKKASRGGK